MAASGVLRSGIPGTAAVLLGGYLVITGPSTTTVHGEGRGLEFEQASGSPTGISMTDLLASPTG